MRMRSRGAYRIHTVAGHTPTGTGCTMAFVGKQRSYPPIRRDETAKEEHFGVTVPDPYRWLEDPDAVETQAFVEAQNAISEPFISDSPSRDKFHARLVSWRGCAVPGTGGVVHARLSLGGAWAELHPQPRPRGAALPSTLPLQLFRHTAHDILPVIE